MKFSFKNSPSKFGRGVGLLWRGNDLNTINKLIMLSIGLCKKGTSHNTFDSNIFLFESARSALYHCLCSYGIGVGDEVIVSSFTCEAVSYGVSSTGARIIYVDINDDLTMNDCDVMQTVSFNTKAVVLQNTFGRLGLKLATIEALRAKGIFVIEDCSLAIGSEFGGKPLGVFGDVSIWTLEVSKTVTIGWGGVLSINNMIYHDSIVQRYNSIKAVPLFLDLRRIFQLWFSVLLTKIKMPGAVFLWYLLYGIRVFRKSNNLSKLLNCHFGKMGKLSSSLFFNLHPLLDDIFKKTNANYKFLLQEAIKLNLNCPIVEKVNDYIVTPRIPLLVKSKHLSAIIKEGDKIGVEVGRWFAYVPPKFGLLGSEIYSAYNAQKISNCIINFPCHWTLNNTELGQVVALMKYISLLQ
ncbi:MAG: DegT/DnrJ/EryC1/StrS family aminotransferase [Coxiellaceae bacterium]|jgi:dTDP-4-amino-4,6-dideoxygalactose transaminase|nr:DegT/DnrJ/EryC1/StrS family aminotransferase [Coxiellaceae bacterium]